MTLEQLKFFFKFKILFFVCKLLCQEKKKFLCAKDDLLCAKAISIKIKVYFAHRKNIDHNNYFSVCNSYLKYILHTKKY